MIVLGRVSLLSGQAMGCIPEHGIMKYVSRRDRKPLDKIPVHEFAQSSGDFWVDGARAIECQPDRLVLTGSCVDLRHERGRFNIEVARKGAEEEPNLTQLSVQRKHYRVQRGCDDFSKPGRRAQPRRKGVER